MNIFFLLRNSPFERSCLGNDSNSQSSEVKWNPEETTRPLFSLLSLLLLSSDFFYCTVLVSFFSSVAKRRFLTTALISRARGRDSARLRVSLIKIRNNRRQSYRDRRRRVGILTLSPSPSHRVASSRDLRTLFTGARSPLAPLRRRAICLPCFSTRSRRICFVARRRLCVFKANAESMTAYLAAFRPARSARNPRRAERNRRS